MVKFFSSLKFNPHNLLTSVAQTCPFASKHLYCRPVVLWPDGDPASSRDHLWVRKRRGERSPELHELPDGPASLHHGDLRSPTRTLWHLSYHFCIVHHHRAHDVLHVCTQSKEKTPPGYLDVSHIHVCLPALNPLQNESLAPFPSAISLQQSPCDLPVLSHYLVFHSSRAQVQCCLWFICIRWEVCDSCLSQNNRQPDTNVDLRLQYLCEVCRAVAAVRLFS